MKFTELHRFKTKANKDNSIDYKKKKNAQANTIVYNKNLT